MNSRLLSSMRLIRTVGLGSCCLLAVATLLLMLCNKWWVMTVSYDPHAGEPRDFLESSGWLIGCRDGVVWYTSIHQRFEPEPGLDVGATRTTTSSFSEIFNPVLATRRATSERQKWGAFGDLVFFPLFIIPSFFASWPTLHWWRRWRRSLRRKTT